MIGCGFGRELTGIASDRVLFGGYRRVSTGWPGLSSAAVARLTLGLCHSPPVRNGNCVPWRRVRTASSRGHSCVTWGSAEQLFARTCVAGVGGASIRGSTPPSPAPFPTRLGCGRDCCTPARTPWPAMTQLSGCAACGRTSPSRSMSACHTVVVITRAVLASTFASHARCQPSAIRPRRLRGPQSRTPSWIRSTCRGRTGTSSISSCVPASSASPHRGGSPQLRAHATGCDDARWSWTCSLMSVTALPPRSSGVTCEMSSVRMGFPVVPATGRRVDAAGVATGMSGTAGGGWSWSWTGGRRIRRTSGSSTTSVTTRSSSARKRRCDTAGARSSHTDAWLPSRSAGCSSRVAGPGR